MIFSIQLEGENPVMNINDKEKRKLTETAGAWGGSGGGEGRESGIVSFLKYGHEEV